MTTAGQKLIFQAALTSVPEQRRAIIEKLSATDIDVGFEALDNLLKQANISQRPLIADLANKFIDLGAGTRLNDYLSASLLDEEFPPRNVSWLACQLDTPFGVPHIDRILSSPDPDVVLPYLFRVINHEEWTDLLAELAHQHPHQRVQLWAQYLTDYLDGKDVPKAPFALLELDQLGDLHVDGWITQQLESGFYDANILAVCSEREDSKYFHQLWERIWERPKHKDLAVRTLTVTAAHLKAPVPQLFSDALSSDDEDERSELAKRLAQTCSNKVFQRAKDLCQDEDNANKELGIQILSYFGSPWHPARPECVKLVLEALNDEEHDIRSRALDCLFITERERMEQAASNLAPDAVTSSGVRETWDMLLEEPLAAHQGSRRELQETFADRLPPKPVKQTVTPENGKGYRQPQNAKANQQAKQQKNRRPLLFTIAALLTLSLAGLLSYGLWPREVTKVPGVMTTQELTPDVKIEVDEEEDESTDDSNVDDQSIGDAVEGRRAAQLNATMKQPHHKLMLERSECWYLYHRMAPIDSGQYVSKGPVPRSPDDPSWEVYTTHLLRFIDDEISKGLYYRAGEFLMTIATLRPQLANQLIPRILDSAGFLDRDDMSAALVQGGAIDVPQLLVHPSLGLLSPAVRQRLQSELLSGWKTDDELALANYLSSLSN